jgi:small neutral amino acid transporter SnatA (MarC family)
LTILLVAGGVLALLVGVAMILRAGTLTTRMIEELNAESPRNQKLSKPVMAGPGGNALVDVRLRDRLACQP